MRHAGSAGRLLLVAVMALLAAPTLGGQQEDLDGEVGSSLVPPTQQDGTSSGESASAVEREEPAEDPLARFVKAGDAYREGRYEEAAGAYAGLLREGFHSGDLHYNHGNALLRSGRLGEAIAAFRRALVVDPRDQDARANLAFARRSAQDDLAPPEPPVWARTLFFWHYGMGSGEVARLAILVGVLFWGLLGLVVVGRAGSGSRVALTVTAVVLLALIGSLVARRLAPSRVAVVLPAEVEVFSGTDLRSRVIFNLHAGAELEVTRVSPDWTQFSLTDGRRGWIPTEQVALVDSSRL